MEENKTNQEKTESQSNLEQSEQIYDSFKKIQVIGHNDKIRKNFQFIQENVMIFISGLTYKIFNIQTQQVETIESKDGGGIGSIAVHPTSKYFAIGEKGNHPNIYIYSYPGLQLSKTLKKGTEKNYSCINFSKNGEKLASVGSYPDYSLTIWDWRKEQTILKVKAFSQDVYNVGFSLYNDNILCTVGMAHIKFWKIANTFTGLKLKGQIGKFGQVELSDIRSFVIMQDRKVISGSESGFILLWEGNFIKAVIQRQNNKPCHDGNIECLKILNGNLLVSSGEDNFIRFWDLDLIDQLQSDEQQNAQLDPLREIQIDKDCEKVNIIDIQAQFIEQNILILYNQKGNIYKITFQNKNFQKCQYQIQVLYEFQNGNLKGVYKDQNQFVAGYDSGQFISFDKDNFMAQQIKEVKNTKLSVVHQYQNNIFIGDINGILRIYDNQYKLRQTLRVFDNSITNIIQQNQFLLVFNQKEVFCLIYKNNEFFPNFMYVTQSCIISYDLKDNKLLIGLQNGYTKCIILKEIDQELTLKDYIIDKQIIEEKTGILRMTEDQKPKQDEDDIIFVLNDKIEIEDVEWDPQPIKTILHYLPETDFVEEDLHDKLSLVGSECEFLGFLYVINLSNSFTESQSLVRPIKSIKIRNSIVTKMIYNESNSLLLLGYEDGIIETRNIFNLKEIFTRTQGHDQQYGKIIDIFYQPEQKVLVSISQDNSIVQYDLEIKNQKLLQKSKHKIIIAGQIQDQFDGQQWEKYSLQQQKIQAVEDQKIQEAEIYKKRLRNNLSELRTRYENLQQKNNDLKQYFQLSKNEIQFDEQFTLYLQDKKEQNVQEVLKEIQYDKVLSQMKVEKLKKFYLDNLQNSSFAVQKLTKKQFLYSIKLQKISQFMQHELDRIYKIIEKENQNNNEQLIQDQTSSVNSQSESYQGNLIDILNQIKIQYNENKNQDYFKKTKANIKEECRIFETIDKMREFKEKISNEIKELRKEEPKIQSVENCSEIIKAKENFGNYILKSSNNYKVNEENRINVQNIKTQIFLMEKFYYNSCQTFNDALIQLKQRKTQLITEIKNANTAIQDINQKLNIKEDFFTYHYDQIIEDPLSTLQVNKEEVENYMQDLEKQQKKKKQGVFGGMENEEIQNNQNQDINTDQNSSNFLQNIFTNKSRINRLKNIKNPKMDKLAKIQQVILSSQKTQIRNKLNNKIKQFEEDMDWTIEERVKLKFELKMAKIKILELYRDLLEVEIYEEEDNILLNQLIEQREILKSWNEKKTINATRLKESKKQDQQTRNHLELAQEVYREKVFPSEIEKAEFVYNYYKLHYKTNIEKENSNDINGEDFTNQNIDNEKKEWILIVEQNDDWLELLKKRRQCEEDVKAVRDERIQLDNECLKIEENLIQIQKNLTNIKYDIDNLQLIKQKKLNQLFCSFILSYDQIYNELPLETIQDQTLFTENQFYQLKNRIQELKKECKDIENEKVQLNSSLDSLTKELILLRQVHKKSTDELKENFHLKFGEVIDLKILDQLKQTKKLKELKQQLKDQDISSTKKIEEANISLQNTKKELYLLKKKNTEIIKRITVLGQTQLKLNKTLDSTNKHIFKNEDNQNNESIQKYRKDLLSIIKLLNQELDDLKKEIIQLKSKGTSCQLNQYILKESNLLNNYNKVHDIIHPVFDRISIYQDRYHPNKKIFSKTRICSDYATYQEVLDEVSLRFELNHPNILNLIDFTAQTLNDQLQNSEIEVKNYYQLPEKNLHDILRLSPGNNNRLSINQLLELSMSILKALDHLYKFELFHGDLRPQYIGLNDIGDFVLLDRLNESSSLELQKIHIQNKEKVYMSQDLLNYLREDGSSEEKFNSLQSELFSLGIILLECGLNKSVNDIYDLHNLRLNFQRLQDYQNQFRQQYQQSSFLLFLLDEFLNTDCNTDISYILNKAQNAKRNQNLNNTIEQKTNAQEYNQKQPLFQNHYYPLIQTSQQNYIQKQQVEQRYEKPSFNPQNPKRRSRIKKNYSQQTIVDHPFLGQITILQQENSNQKIFMKKTLCSNFDELGIIIEQIRCRFEANHPNILKILDYSTQDLPRNPQNKRFLISTYFEYPQQFLKEVSIDEFKNIDNLQKFISDILNAFLKLQEMQIFHKDIRQDFIAKNEQGNYILVDLQDQRTSAEIQIDRINQNNDIYISEEFFQFLLNQRTDEDSVDNFNSELFGFGLILIELVLGLDVQQIYNYQDKKIEYQTLRYFENQFKSKFYQNEALIYIIHNILNFQNSQEDFKTIVQNYKNLIRKNQSLKETSEYNKKANQTNVQNSKTQIPQKPKNILTTAQLYRKSQLDRQINRTSDQDHETLGEIILCQTKGSNYEDIFEKEYFCKNEKKLKDRVKKLIRRLSLNYQYLLQMIDYSVTELQQNSLKKKYKISAYFKLPNTWLQELLDLPSNRPYIFREDQIIKMCIQILKALQHLKLHNKDHKDLKPKYIATNQNEDYILLDQLEKSKSFEDIQKNNIRNQELLYLNEEVLQIVYAGDKCKQKQLESNQLFSLGLILMKCFIDIDIEELYDLEHLKINKKLLKEYKEEFKNKCASEGVLRYIINILIPDDSKNSKNLLEAIQLFEQFEAKQAQRKKLGIQFKKTLKALLKMDSQQFKLNYNNQQQENQQQTNYQQEQQKSQQYIHLHQSYNNQQKIEEPLFGYNNSTVYQSMPMNQNNLPLKTYTTRESQQKYTSNRVYSSRQEQPKTRRIYVRADRSNSVIKRMNEEEKNAQNGKSNILNSILKDNNFDQRYKNAQLIQQQGNFQVYRIQNKTDQEISKTIQNSYIEHMNNPNKRISRIIRTKNEPPIRSKSNIRSSNIRFSKYQEYTTSPITVSVERRISKSSFKRVN